MTQYTDVMIDLETLSTRPNAVILTAGMIAFNRDTGECQSVAEGFYGNLTYADQSERHIDIKTVEWWMKQSQAARDEVFGNNKGGVPVKTPEMFLKIMNLFFENFAKPRVRVWAKSPQFDLIKIQDYIGYDNHVPWKYNDERCVRTELEGRNVADITGIVEHKAIADSWKQAQEVISVNRR